MIALDDLTQLNEADLRLDRVKAQIAEIDADLGEPPWQEALVSEIAAQQELLDDTNSRRREAEEDLDQRRTRIESEDAKLYDGSIKESRELRNQQEAVYALRRGLKEAEDPALAVLEVEDAQRQSLDYLSALKSGTAETWSAAQTELQGTRDGLASDASTLQEEVAGWRSEISQGDLAIYDEQRLKRPIVIANVVGGVCGSCRLTLPTTLLTRARRGTEPVFCPTCFCIIHVP